MQKAMRFHVTTILIPILGLGLALSSAASPRTKLTLRSKAAQSHLPMHGQSRTLMPDGRLLLIGGEGPEGPQETAFFQNLRTAATAAVSGKLHHARAWHSATLLPDGKVLVLGGIGGDGKIVGLAESFDPATEAFETLQPTGLTPRAYHTATLLTDGEVLVAGGMNAGGETLGNIELWNFLTGLAKSFEVALAVARTRHTATLLADGTVLFWGGIDANGVALNYGEVFDPTIGQRPRLETSPVQLASDTQGPLLEASLPQDGSTDIPVNAIIALRFSKPLRVETVSIRTVTLSSSQGAVEARVVPAEGGMLAFVTPKASLESGTNYTLSLAGATDNSNLDLSSAQISFKTAGTPPNSPTSGGLIGPAGNTGSSAPDPLNSPMRKLPPLQAAPGVTALAGQVLKLDGEPLEDVSVEIGSISARTDGTGRFLLHPLTAGHHVMWIDGSSAGSRKTSYGIFEDGVDILAGQTNALNYTIWMTALDTAHAVTIPSPTQSEVVVSTPTLPGLELHIPPQATILDHNGNVVTQVSITPIPVKQPPFPLPKDVLVPLYFTIQPGGAYIKVANANGPQGAQLYYPNSYHYPAGTVFNFYNYDADVKGWYVYGQGKVSPDRNQVIPNAGVSIYEFTGAMVSNPSNAPPNAPKPRDNKPGDNPQPGEPVDIQTGLFVYHKTDLVLPDVIPIVLTRTYRPNDYTPRAFGIGTNHPYDMFMVGDSNSNSNAGYTYQDLILPDGGRIHFTRTSPCSSTGYCSYGDAVYTATSTTTDFYGATVRYIFGLGLFPRAAWMLKKKDGTVFWFPDSDAFNLPQAAAPIGMQDRYGNALTFTRDGNYNLTRIASPNGRWMQFSYDTSNRILQAQDNLGRTVTYTYDPGGRLSTATDANGGMTTYTYDSNNNMLTIKDARGIVNLTNQYDVNNRVIKQTQADNSIFQFAYTLDTNGNVTQANVTDPRGNVEQVAFNSDGYMTSDTHALGKPEQQTVTYNRQVGSGLLLSTTDALNRQTSFTYDSMGNTTSITRLAGTPNAVTTYLAYEPTFNRVTAVTDPLGHTTSFTYDNSGNLVAAVDPLGNTASIAYNSAGQPTSVTDPSGNTAQLAYDSGDVVGVTDPLGRTVNRFLDSAGRLVSLTDPVGHITKYSYNPLNQVLSATDPRGNLTSFSYDPNGNLQSVTDANNHITQYTYDNMDRVATRKDPLLNQESYQYDGNGNLTQFTDRRGKVTTFQYDGLNRRTFAGFGTQAGPTYESTVTYTFDGGNRLTTTVDSITGTITRGYDGLNRLTSDATPQGTVTYMYDNAGRRASLTVPGQSVVNYTFDNASRLTQIAQGTATVGFTYDAANRRAALTLPNGIVTSYSYDGASQLTGLTYTNGSTTVGNLTYGYDNAGRRTNMGGSLAQTGLPNPVSITAYNANNQLTTWGTANLSYDLNGNMTSDGTHSYAWDARNRLSTMDFGNTASFAYDPFGRRTSKTIVGSQTGFLYDGANAVQELSGSTATANLLSGGIDEIFQRTDSAGARNFLTDALGSTLALTDSTGTTQSSYTFDPFGNTTSNGALSSNSFAYTGRELDATGLYFYRARYYNPIIQRFISEDPIRLRGGPNLYSYAFDSPLNGTDPSGRWTVNLGGNVQVSFWGLDFQYTGGIVVDSEWNFGVYNTGGGGAAAGAGISLSLTGGGSSGRTICSFGGPFVQVGGNAGLGPEGGASGYLGFEKDGTPIIGLSANAGVGAAASVYDDVTVTKVTPLIGRKPACP